MKVVLLKGVLCSALAVCVAAHLHAQRPGGGPGGGGPGGGHQGMPMGGGGGFPGGQGNPGGFPPGGGRSSMPPPAPREGREGDVPRNGTHTAMWPTGRWWDDRNFAMSIGLKKDQQRKMDAIFNKNKPALMDGLKNWQIEQSKLEALMNLPQPDKQRLFAQIDAVNQARATLEKVTTQMLLQIRQQMEPDQVARLDKLRDRSSDEPEN